MPTEKKAQAVSELQELISRCSVGIFTDYRGLSTAELNDLRRKLRDAGVSYRVVKNSLAQIAAKGARREDLSGLFQGPLAIALGYDDEVKPAKVLVDYIKTTRSILTIKGGFLSSRLLTSSEVESLATIPPTEILIGKLMAGLQSPIYRLVNSLSSPLRGLAGVLQARINQLEEG
jgi:large subunit ribosomal protein L10